MNTDDPDCLCRTAEADEHELAILEFKLPRWKIEFHPGATVNPWWAESPSHHPVGEVPGDGILIVGPTPDELVERVRANERLIALAANIAGSLAVGRPQTGVTLPGPLEIEADVPPVVPLRPVPPTPKATAPSKSGTPLDPTALGPPEPTEESLKTAKLKGYDGGEFCGNCGSPNTRRTSSACLLCDGCGQTTGCS